MATRSSIPRRVVQAIAACSLVGAALVGLGAPAGASSTITQVSAEACVGGTVGRDVSVSYTTDAPFTTAVRIHVVAGTTDGPIIETSTVEIQGPASLTVRFTLPAGTYFFDWEDRAGDGVTWSGRHSGLGEFYAGVYESTRTEVIACEPVVVDTTTTVPSSSTEVSSTTVSVPTTPSSPDVTPFAPPPTAQASTTVTTTPTTVTTTPTTGVTTVPTTPPPATAQTTASVPPGETAITGGNPVPMLLAGTAFLGLGVAALFVARRIPGRPI